MKEITYKEWLETYSPQMESIDKPQPFWRDVSASYAHRIKNAVFEDKIWTFVIPDEGEKYIMSGLYHPIGGEDKSFITYYITYEPFIGIIKVKYPIS